MPQALTIQIAQEVADLLGGMIFSRPTTPERVYDWEGRLEELQEEEGVRLLVVPGGIEGEWESRAGLEEEVVVDVGVVAKLKTVTAAEVDALMLLAEEVERFVLVADGGPRHLDTDPDAVCTAAEVMPIYSPKHLRTQRMFVSVIHCTFLLLREV